MERPLFDEFAILIKRFIIVLAELLRSWLVPRRLENISTLCVLHLQSLDVCIFEIVPVVRGLDQIGDIMQLSRQILFNIYTK